MNRRSGVLVPLFSLASTRSWGVGEYTDLVPFARWLELAGQRFVQILPITECPDAENSPYSALSAMALDTIFIAVPEVHDFNAIGGEAAMPVEDREALARLRRASRVCHRDIRELKGRWLRRAHQHFVAKDAAAGTERAHRFEAFCHRHASWLDDYALFRALRSKFNRAPWWEWPEPLAQRAGEALTAARAELRDEIAYRKYAQWIAEEQWAASRRACGSLQVLGDVPFMISGDSPDVWTRQEEFRFDATVGVPPDAFSETGQDWGLPPMRWDAMEANEFEWIRRRAERTAQLFDGFRLDHLVGLYRTYIRPTDDTVEPSFSPEDEQSQTALGETLVSIYRATGAEIIAEDLGTVPDFVRESLQKLAVPGYKVLRWERRWKEEPEQPYIDPGEYDEVAVATTGTHDTEPLVTWWNEMDEEERAAVLQMPSIARYVEAGAPPLDAVLRGLLDSPAGLVILPLQDIFGWPDRVNVPAQVSDENWSWIVPWRVDTMRDHPEARARAHQLAEWTRAAGR